MSGYFGKRSRRKANAGRTHSLDPWRKKAVKALAAWRAREMGVDPAKAYFSFPLHRVDLVAEDMRRCGPNCNPHNRRRVLV